MVAVVLVVVVDVVLDVVVGSVDSNRAIGSVVTSLSELNGSKSDSEGHGSELSKNPSSNVSSEVSSDSLLSSPGQEVIGHSKSRDF